MTYTDPLVPLRCPIDGDDIESETTYGGWQVQQHDGSWLHGDSREAPPIAGADFDRRGDVVVLRPCGHALTRRQYELALADQLRRHQEAKQLP